jgi:hypothetical protein
VNASKKAGESADATEGLAGLGYRELKKGILL